MIIALKFFWRFLIFIYLLRLFKTNLLPEKLGIDIVVVIVVVVIIIIVLR